MTTQVIQVKNPILKEFIQFFIFFRANVKQVVNYTTFPNNNLCLALYKHNEVLYNKNSQLNYCKILQGKQTYTSRLLGFHEIPFQVSIEAPIDQICILFQPTALRMFTNETYKELLNSNEAFNHIFSSADPYFLELLFNEENLTKRADLLEHLLLKNLKRDNLSIKMKWALHLIYNETPLKVGVTEIAKELGMNNSTLYRLFANQLGQNPKTFLKTIRFRNVLEDLLRNDTEHLTKVAYANHYFDQAHFIKDFKSLSGVTPKQLKPNISLQQEKLAWIYNTK